MKKKTLFWIIVLFILILYVGIVGYLSYKGGYFVDNTINIGNCLNLTNFPMTSSQA